MGGRGSSQDTQRDGAGRIWGGIGGRQHPWGNGGVDSICASIWGTGAICRGLLGDRRVWRDKENSRGPWGGLRGQGLFLALQPLQQNYPAALPPPPHQYLFARLLAVVNTDTTGGTWSGLWDGGGFGKG